MASRNPKSEEQLIDALCLARAVESNAMLVYCNAAGVMTNPDGSKDTLIGHSQITMPIMGPLHRLNHHREALFIQEVSTEPLQTSAKIYHA